MRDGDSIDLADVVGEVLGLVRPLGAYAASEGFLGYFESVSYGKWRDEAIALFFGFFAEALPRGFLVTSATQSVAREKSQSDEVRAAMRELADLGWIRPDMDAGELPEQLRAWAIAGCDPATLRRLCELVLDGYVFGHVFFYFRDQQMVVYPHEDYGFGVIVPREAAGERLGLGFLQEAAKPGTFSVEVRRHVAMEGGER